MTGAMALSWSGGKDSALALRALLDEDGSRPAALLTTVTEDYGRVSMHGVRRELVAAQAEAIGIPLIEVGIPATCPNEVYEARMSEALSSPPLDGVSTMAFADLFLEDIRAYREGRLALAGKQALFPLWGATRPSSPWSSSRPGSRPCWCALIRRSSTPRSSGVPTT